MTSSEWKPFWIEDFNTFNESRWIYIDGDGCPDLCGWYVCFS
jgi:hypothetical protein